MDKEIFDGIMEGLKEAIEIEQGKRNPISVVEIFPEPKAVRKQLNLSQPKFAKFIGVKTDTLRNWEYGRRRIPATARRLLYIAQKHPEIILEMTNMK